MKVRNRWAGSEGRSRGQREGPARLLRVLSGSKECPIPGPSLLDPKV